jgi:phosphonate transport system substrate-binding protein
MFSYLAPSLPEELFVAVARHVAAATGFETHLTFETATSGPAPGTPDPFSAGAADIGFLCAPTYRTLATLRPAPIDLLGAAPVFTDPRAAGRPIYFSDVVVPRASRAREFSDLRGRVWAYNDVCSLSGYHSMLRKVAGLGLGAAFFGELRHVGTHLAAVEQVAAGAADAAAIDSNVLVLELRRDPSLDRKIRVLESWGPFPVQPVVARATLGREVKIRVTAALLAAGELYAGLRGFGKVSEADYESVDPIG